MDFYVEDKVLDIGVKIIFTGNAGCRNCWKNTEALMSMQIRSWRDLTFFMIRAA